MRSKGAPNSGATDEGSPSKLVTIKWIENKLVANKPAPNKWAPNYTWARYKEVSKKQVSWKEGSNTKSVATKLLKQLITKFSLCDRLCVAMQDGRKWLLAQKGLCFNCTGLKHAPGSMIVEFASDPPQSRDFYIPPKMLIVMGPKESNQLRIVYNITCWSSITQFKWMSSDSE